MSEGIILALWGRGVAWCTSGESDRNLRKKVFSRAIILNIYKKKSAEIFIGGSLLNPFLAVPLMSAYLNSAG
jgi:hypothetical protein